MNPGPVAIDNTNAYASLPPFSRASLCKSHMSCLHFNANDLNSFTRTTEGLLESNLTNFKTLFILRTWMCLNVWIFDGKVLPADYNVFRSDRFHG